jgi:hypothetical protein
MGREARRNAIAQMAKRGEIKPAAPRPERKPATGRDLLLFMRVAFGHITPDEALKRSKG